MTGNWCDHLATFHVVFDSSVLPQVKAIFCYFSQFLSWVLQKHPYSAILFYQSLCLKSAIFADFIAVEAAKFPRGRIGEE